MAVPKKHVTKECHRDECGEEGHESERLFDKLLEQIKCFLESGEDMLISCFGKFCDRETPDRRARNPQAGEDFMLPSRNAVTFKPSGMLKRNGRKIRRNYGNLSIIL